MEGGNCELLLTLLPKRILGGVVRGDAPGCTREARRSTGGSPVTAPPLKRNRRLPRRIAVDALWWRLGGCGDTGFF